LGAGGEVAARKVDAVVDGSVWAGADPVDDERVVDPLAHEVKQRRVVLVPFFDSALEGVQTLFVPLVGHLPVGRTGGYDA
jgi:hypothetical protein